MALRPATTATMPAGRLKAAGSSTVRRLWVCVLLVSLPLSALASEITLVKRASRVAAAPAAKISKVAKPKPRVAKPKEPAVKQVYKIKAGDSLSSILVANLNPRHEDMAALMAEVRRLNPHIADINNIPAGRSIVLPQSRSSKPLAPVKPPVVKAAAVKPAPAKVVAPSASPVLPESAPPAVQEVVVVQKGQCLGLILRERYGLPDEAIFGEFLNSIKVANPGIRDLNLVSPGQQIVIPKIPEKFFQSRPAVAAATAPVESSGGLASAEVRFVDVPKGAVIVRQKPGDSTGAVNPAAPGPVKPETPKPVERPQPSAASRSLVKALNHMGLEARAHGDFYVPSADGQSLNVDLSQVPLLELPGDRKVFLDIDKRLSPSLRRAIQAVLPGSAFVDGQSDLDATVGAVLRQAGYYSVNRNTPLFVGGEEKLRFSGNYVVYKDSSRRNVCLVNLLSDSAERTPRLITAYAKRFGIEIVEIGGRPDEEVKAASAPSIVQLNHSYPNLLKALGKTGEQGVKLQLVNEGPVKLGYVAPLKYGQVILADRLPDETTQNLLRMRGYNLIQASAAQPAEVLSALGIETVAAPFRLSLPNGHAMIELEAARVGKTLLLERSIDADIARYLTQRGYELLVW